MATEKQCELCEEEIKEGQRYIELETHKIVMTDTRKKDDRKDRYIHLSCLKETKKRD